MSLAGIINGRFWTPGGPVRGDLRIEDGRVVAIGAGAGADIEGEVLDAAGLDVLPGAVDLHVHVADRQGPHPIADGFLSGSQAGVLGGVTTFVAFATQRPGETVSGCVERFAAAAIEDGSFADWAIHVTPTTWDASTWADIEVLAARGLKSLKVYTTYREAGLEVGPALLRDILGRAAALGLTVLVHCEEPSVLEASIGAGDPAAADSHPDLRPPEAEYRAVQRVVTLALATGCSTHIVHVSHPGTVGLVVDGRDRGGSVTCETCPQYLVMDRELLADRYGYRLLCTPPFRDPEDRDLLLKMTMSGLVDLLATDHCPFTKDAKDSGDGDRRRTPMGLPGIGALVPIAYELLVEPGAWTLGELALRVAEVPARVAGLWPLKGAIAVGSDADLVVLDTRGAMRPVRGTLADVYDPWSTCQTALAFRAVVVRGEVVVRDDRMAGRVPQGRCAWR